MPPSAPPSPYAPAAPPGYGYGAPAAPGGPGGEPYGYPGAPPSPPPPPPPHAPSRSRHRGALVAVAAIVLVLILIIGLGYVGVLPIGIAPGGGGNGGQGGGGTPTALTYREALAVANSSVVHSRPGGPWQVARAEAYQIGAAVHFPLRSPCSLEGYAPNSTSLMGTGSADLWYIGFVSVPFTSWSHALYVSVWNDSGVLTAQVDPVGWCSAFGIYNPVPWNVSDSPALMVQASAWGGTSFLRSHPYSSVQFGVSLSYNGPGYGVEPVWSVQYQSIYPRTGGPYSYLYLDFQANTLALLSSTWGNGTAGGTNTHPMPFQVTFARGSQGSSGAGSVYYDNVSFTATPQGMSTFNLSLSIQQANATLVNSGAPGTCTPPFTSCSAPAGGGWIAVLRSAAGAPVDEYPSSAGSTSWSFVGSVPISGTMTLELLSTFPLAGSGDTIRAWSYYDDTSGQVVL